MEPHSVVKEFRGVTGDQSVHTASCSHASHITHDGTSLDCWASTKHTISQAATACTEYSVISHACCQAVGDR